MQSQSKLLQLQLGNALGENISLQNGTDCFLAGGFEPYWAFGKVKKASQS